MTESKPQTTPIMIFPVKYLRVLLQAVTALRKVKAFPANMFSHSGIGHCEDKLLHDDLKALEGYLVELNISARTMKAKSFEISLGNVNGRGLV